MDGDDRMDAGSDIGVVAEQMVGEDASDVSRQGGSGSTGISSPSTDQVVETT